MYELSATPKTFSSDGCLVCVRVGPCSGSSSSFASWDGRSGFACVWRTWAWPDWSVGLLGAASAGLLGTFGLGYETFELGPGGLGTKPGTFGLGRRNVRARTEDCWGPGREPLVSIRKPLGSDKELSVPSKKLLGSNREPLGSDKTLWALTKKLSGPDQKPLGSGHSCK